MTELPPGASPLDRIGPGTRLREWRVERFVARGAFGRVYEAKRASWVADEPTRALKIFDPILSSAAREALIGEFGILREVDHPNLLDGIDAFDVEEGPLAGCVVFVLELADDDLATEAARAGTLRADAVAVIGAQVADGLGVLHAGGRLHGDVKPENVLRVGRTWKLGDFGVSAALQGSYAVAQGATLDYRPPELSSADDTRIHRSTDVWALGVTLWVAATGQHPFVGADAQLRYAAVLRGDRRPRGAAIDPRLADLLDQRCLAADPHDRADATELAAELRRLADVIATEPAPEPRASRTAEPDPTASTVDAAPSRATPNADAVQDGGDPTQPLGDRTDPLPAGTGQRPPTTEPTAPTGQAATAATADVQPSAGTAVPTPGDAHASPAPPGDAGTDVAPLAATAGRSDEPPATGSSTTDAPPTFPLQSAVTAAVVGAGAAGIAVEASSLLAAVVLDGLTARRIAYLAVTVILLVIAGLVALRRGVATRLVGVAAIAAVVVVALATAALFR